MRDAGYFTANVRSMPASFGFSGTGKTDWNFTHDGKPFDSDSWADLKAHQPFFAQVNFQETHRDFHAPKRADPAKVVIPPYYPDHPVTRRDWAAYLDAASELDRKVGLILEQLEADGLAGNDDRRVHGRPRPGARPRASSSATRKACTFRLIIRWPDGVSPPEALPGRDAWTTA